MSSDTELTERALPYYVIKAAVENAPESAEYVVVASDNDHPYADSLAEANELAELMRESNRALRGSAASKRHSVAIVELQEVPPEA